MSAVQNQYGTFDMPSWYNDVKEIPKGKYDPTDISWEIIKKSLERQLKPDVLPYNTILYSSDPHTYIDNKLHKLPEDVNNSLEGFGEYYTSKKLVRGELFYLYTDPIEPLWKLTSLCDKVIEGDKFDCKGDQLAALYQWELKDNRANLNALGNNFNFRFEEAQAAPQAAAPQVPPATPVAPPKETPKAPPPSREMLISDAMNLLDNQGLRFFYSQLTNTPLSSRKQCRESTTCARVMETTHYNANGTPAEETEMISEFSIPGNLFKILIEAGVIVNTCVYYVDVNKLLVHANDDIYTWNPVTGDSITDVSSSGSIVGRVDIKSRSDGGNLWDRFKKFIK